MALTIEAIDEQFITVGTTDYDLVIDIGGDPDTVDPTGHMEGFTHHWDAANGQLHIKSDEVTRLLSGVHWDIKIAKDMKTVMRQIAYNVIQAAPIFQTLQTIHLYRGVDINFDIVIQNIPPLLIPNARLLGLKSELVEYGINVNGKIGTTDHFTFNRGEVSIIVPSETGGEATVHNFPYVIESGKPPVIESPEFRPRGNYGELTFGDVNHAFGYEWTLQDGDDPTWHAFSDTRPVINPSSIEVTPGTLNVTLKFPNISGASSYAYQLVSEHSETLWREFTGTFENGFITTIIPDLQEGVEYDLRLRVASPWIGAPISIKVYGGRMCYVLNRDSTGPSRFSLYIFHSGHKEGSLATRIKRLLLPVSMIGAFAGGLAVNSDGDVFICNLVAGRGNEKALYTFLASTIENAADGSRLVQDRKNLFSRDFEGSPWLQGMGIYENTLYAYFSNFNVGVHQFSLPTVDGVELPSNRLITSFNDIHRYGFSVTEESFWYPRGRTARIASHVSRTSPTAAPSGSITLRNLANTSSAPLGNGLKVIGTTIYDMYDNQGYFRAFRPSAGSTNYVQDFFIRLPTGLDAPRYLDIL